MSFSNPINFPFPANDGDTYEFESRVYNYQKASGLPGYWELTNPGSLGAAGGAEITSARVDGGGNNSRYIGPQGLAESDYLNTTSYTTKDSLDTLTGPFDLAKGEPLNFTRNEQAAYNGEDDPLNGLKFTASETGIDVLMERASNVKWGSTNLSHAIVDGSQERAGSSFAVSEACRRGSESAYMKNQKQSGSTPAFFRIKPSSQSTTGFQVLYAYQPCSTSSHSGTITIPNDLSFSSNEGGLGAIFLMPISSGVTVMTVSHIYSTGFTYFSSGGAGGFYYMVLGMGTGMSKASNPYRVYSPDGTVN